jgi:hypothetical protein
LSKPYKIKLRCYWEHLGECIWEHLRNLGILWELDEKMLRTHWEQGEKQTITFATQPHPQKWKNRPDCECRLSLPISCMKFLFPNLLVTNFWPGLMARAEIWGIVKLPVKLGKDGTGTPCLVTFFSFLFF